MREMMARQLSKGGRVDYFLGEGVQFIEIIRQVIRGRHDLVVKESDAGAARDSHLDSTDMHLLRKCPSPVWIVNPSHARGYRRILAAIDVDPDNDSNAELNNQILDLSIELARKEGATLHVVHA